MKSWQRYGLACCIFVLAAALAASACGLGASPSQRSAIVYYANETVEEALQSPNYRALFHILQMNSELGADLEAALQFDASHFPSVVARDQRVLEGFANRGGMDLFVFTNSMAKRDEYLFVDSRKRSTETRPLGLAPFPADPVLDNSPLSRSAALIHALETVLRDSNGISTDLYLIANTHGTDDFAMIPRVAANFVTANPDQVLAQLSANGQSDLSLPLELSGIRKLAFWEAISAVSDRFLVKFPLLFVESCESAPHRWSEVLAIPSTVTRIAHSGFRGLKPAEIDFAKLFQDSDPARIDTVMASELELSGVEVDSRWRIWIWPLRVSLSQINVWWLFLPLAIWFPVFGYTQWRVRRQS